VPPWVIRDARRPDRPSIAAALQPTCRPFARVRVGQPKAIAAALLIWAFGWTWSDSVASILIALLVVFSAWSLVRQSVSVLMEAAPGHIDVEKVHYVLGTVSKVPEVHDLHVWSR
jgi:cobalt-zinc-cadmium efflux system protein